MEVELRVMALVPFLGRKSFAEYLAGIASVCDLTVFHHHHHSASDAATATLEFLAKGTGLVLHVFEWHHEAAARARFMGAPMAFVCTEQLTRLGLLQETASIVRAERVPVLDFSPENIVILEREIGFHSLHLPFVPCPASLPPQSPDIDDKTWDVVFVGSHSPRRASILDALEVKHGLRVLRIHDTHGSERDSLIVQARVLVNIHYADDYRVTESLRCHPVIYGRAALVLSEDSEHCVRDSLYHWMHFVPYDRLVAETLVMLANYRVFHTLAYTHSSLDMFAKLAAENARTALAACIPPVEPIAP